MIPIRYVGSKAPFRDHLYGSGAEWRYSDVVEVSPVAARKLLTHPEFEDAREDTSVPIKSVVVKETLDDKTEEVEHEPPLVNLDAMTKAQIAEYAYRQFGVELDGKATKTDMANTVRLQMGRRQF